MSAIAISPGPTEAGDDRFRQLAEALPQLIWTAGPDGQADYYNGRFVEYCGLTPTDLGRDGWGSAVHPDDLSRIQAVWIDATRTGEPYELEFRFRRKDGVYRWFLARATPVLADDRVVRWFGTTTDIDARKNAELAQEFLSGASQELGTSLDYEETLRRVARLAVPRLADWAAVDLLDDSGQLHRLAFEHLDPEKIKYVLELEKHYPSDLSAPRGLGQVLRSGKSEYVLDIPDELLVGLARDPEHLRIVRELGLKSYMVVPLKSRDRVLGAISLVYAESGRLYTELDVHFLENFAARTALAIDNARLFRQVQQLNETLEHRVEERTAQLRVALEELESFSYSVSHDLRAPLRHITGFAHLLTRRSADSLDETSRGYVQTITDAAKRGGKLVDDLLEFSRMGRTELKKGPVDLTQLVDEIRIELAPELGGRAILWEVADLPTVQGDRAMLRIVLHNVLANALKYTRRVADARISVTAESTPSEVRLRVRDNGVGFDMKHAGKLFGVFQRLHSDEEFEGTGIGLATVKRIITRHGGHVTAEGASGSGATFTLVLPLRVP